MSFTQPNLPALISDIENLIAQSAEANEDEVEK
jgi:hypothetical protein